MSRRPNYLALCSSSSSCFIPPSSCASLRLGTSDTTRNRAYASTFVCSPQCFSPRLPREETSPSAARAAPARGLDAQSSSPLPPPSTTTAACPEMTPCCCTRHASHACTIGNGEPLSPATCTCPSGKRAEPTASLTAHHPTHHHAHPRPAGAAAGTSLPPSLYQPACHIKRGDVGHGKQKVARWDTRRPRLLPLLLLLLRGQGTGCCTRQRPTPLNRHHPQLPRQQAGPAGQGQGYRRPTASSSFINH